MPKQIIEINPFHGGLNNNGDPRDIKVEELSQAQDIMVDEIGKVRMMGSITGAHYNFSVSAIQPGYGLFQFSSDYKGGDGTVSDGEAETNYFAMWDNDSTVDILETSTARTGIIDLGSGGGKPTFYYADGALRISDGSQGANNTSKWYGFCNRKYFGADADEDFVSWKSLDQLPAAPTDGYIRKHDGGSSVWDKSTNEKPLDSSDSTGDGFLRMSISANTNEDISTWISLEGVTDNTNGAGGADGLDGYWYTKYGGHDGDLSELLDGTMGSSWGGETSTQDGQHYFSPDSPVGGTNTWTDDNRSSGSEDAAGDIQVHVNATVGNCTPNVPPGYDSSIVNTMRLMKTSSASNWCRFAVKTDDDSKIDLDGKSIFFDIYLSQHMVSILDSVQVAVGSHIGDWDTTGSPNNYKKWLIDGTELTSTVSEWQRVEIFTGEDAHAIESSGFLGAVTDFSITIITNSSADKFGYAPGTDADSSEGDCLLYNIRYGDPLEGVGWNGYYNFYYSWLYDDAKQESPLIEFNDHSESTPADVYEFLGSSLNFRAWVKQASGYGFNHASAGNPRITGANVYYQEVDSIGNILEDPEKYLFCNVDFENGIRKSIGDEWSAWAGGASGSIGEWYAPSASPLKLNLPPIGESFAINAGYDDSNKISSLYYKTAVVSNRMSYIGNVKYTDANSKDHVLGDAILKSHVNKFDLFTSDRIIEASIRDGDSIVKLEEYADRLLQFGKKKMQLINVSQELEFLEDTFLHKGVTHPAATCKTDYGIAWVNNNGCYLYDGQRVNDLLEKGGVQIIKESEWESFITDNSIIGYIPKKRQLIILKDCSSSSAGDIYLYDLVTKSWVQGDSKFTDSQIQTNFVTDWNGDLVHAHTSGTVVKWDDASDSTDTMLFATKDMTFGQPGQRKKLHKVYITYKGDASSLVVRYAIDGETDSSDFLQFNRTDTPLADKSSAENLESWHLAELKPTTSSEANNIYSAKFHLSGTAGSSFEINDINVVFRMKNIK